MELYERKTAQGKPYIAVKAGFMIQAIIFPFKVITESFVADVETLAHECRRTLQESERISHQTEKGE